MMIKSIASARVKRRFFIFRYEQDGLLKLRFIPIG